MLAEGTHTERNAVTSTS